MRKAYPRLKDNKAGHSSGGVDRGIFSHKWRSVEAVQS